MSLAIRDEHVALAAAARRFFDTHCPPAVARAGLDGAAGPDGADGPDGGPASLPPFWDLLAATGWLGLAIDPSHGGEGFGMEEVAVVIEEAARAAAPGPLLATLAAAALISAGGSDQLRQELLPGLARGTTIGTAAFPATVPLHGTTADQDGSMMVSGPLRPVLSGAPADVVVAPVQTGSGHPVWCVLPAAAARLTPLPSLDPTRPVAALHFDGHPVAPAYQLNMPPGQATSILAVLAAAECAGGAAWCVDTAAEYAKVRVQFGRPIGQFQGVKHRIADMLVALEQIRASGWDAAGAVDADPAAPESMMAAAIAASVGPTSFLKVAEDCVQVLGGIGFTWEHDAHLYLRRAATLNAVVGTPSRWRREVVDHAVNGVRRRPAAAVLSGLDTFRDSIRAEVESIVARPKDQWRAALVDAGLFVPHWPEPWGRAAGAAEQIIIDEELDRAGVRRANLAVGAWAAPTIAAHGTAAQQVRWVGPTLLGRIKWCQLFSEPGAGSDLASLSTRATRSPDGRGWLLNGQKVWTSLARDADYGICLARTNPAAPKHLGITYFVVDMSQTGLDIRPLREMTGHAMFNEVFLVDVFVPDDHVIGEVDAGWPLARTTLANERVAMGSGSSFGGGIEALLDLVSARGTDTLDPVDADRLGGLLAESHCLSSMGRRTAFRAVAGVGPGPESSVRKLLGVEHDQRTQEFGLSLLGAEGATTDGTAGQWTFGFLANRCLTIAGGTSEVQRNVIAERLLGLPRDPEP